MFKSKIKFNEKELKKFLEWIQEWISYRGGMGNRIDAIDVENKLKGKLKYIRFAVKEFGDEQAYSGA